jgi:DNA-binding transcriptional LysR family regulator
LLAALDDARTAARQPAGTLRVGFTLTTGGTALTRLIHAFTAAHPGCEVQLRETGLQDVAKESVRWAAREMYRCC